MSFPPHMPMMPPMPFFPPVPPMMMPPPNLSTPPPGIPTTANSTSKPGENDKKNRYQGATTVFVGSISERAPDVMIKRILQHCGAVVNWRRVQGADGKLQAFGFCEYENPEGTLRCIRLLNGYLIQDKKLVVKVDAKTKTVLDEYKKKKRRELAKKAAKDLTAFKVLYEEEDENGNSTDTDGKKKSGEEGEIDEEDDDYIDNDTRREDTAVKQSIETVMREYSREMNLKALELKEQAMREAQMAAAVAAAAPPPPPPPSASEPSAITDSPPGDSSPTGPITQRVDPAAALENEEEKRSLITNEIQLFRHRFKDEETKMRNTEKERRDRYERERALQREKRAAEDSAKSPSSPGGGDDRHRSSSSRHHHTSNSIRSLTNDRRTPTSSSRYDRRSPRSYHRRSKSKSPTSRSLRPDETEEEAFERKRQERRAREKETLYREQLKIWEQRERRKRADYQREKELELARLRDEEKESKRLFTFLKDYNDDIQDVKYYKGAALARRIKDRENEILFDDRDLQREKEELADLRKKLINEGQYDDIELEIKQRLKKEEDLIRKRLADLARATSDISSEESDDEQETKKKSTVKNEKQEKKETILEPVKSNNDSKNSTSQPTIKPEPLPENVKMSPPQTSALGGAPITRTKIASKRRLAVNEVFRDDQDDENSSATPKKSKLSTILDHPQAPPPPPPPVVPEPTPVVKEEPTIKAPPPPSDNANSARLQEEKRQAVCKLIESIPTKKEDLFKYPLDWSLLDSTLMEKRVKPWVTKKLVEYLGEEEPTLTEFICTSIMSKKNADTILADIRVVLDNEADVFVVKMWRLIVYEIEAKRNGLSK